MPPDQLNAMVSAGGQQSQQPTSGALQPDQLKAMLGMGLSPQQSAALSGHSTGLLEKTLSGIGGAYNAFSSGLKSVSTGVAQGELSTLQNIGKAVTTPLANATHLPAPQGIPDENLQPQTTGEKIGYTGEKIGEYFAPAGVEKGILAKGAEYIGKLPELLGLTGKTASTIVGALNTAFGGAVSGASAGGVAAAQGSDVGTAGTVGTLAGGLGKALETFGPEITQSLLKSDFKLSPAQENKAASRVQNAAEFMQQNNIIGSDEGKYSSLTNLTDTLENNLQSSLPKESLVPKNDVINTINQSIDRLKTDDPAIYDSAKADADKAIRQLQSTPGDSISVDDALKAKRSYGQQAFKQSKFQITDPTKVADGSYAVEQGFQNALQNTLDRENATIKVPPELSKYFNGATEVSLQDYNKVYSNAINSRNLTGLARFKNDSGLVGRFFGLWAGEAIGQAVAPGLAGKLIFSGAGEMASRSLPGLVRRAGENIASTPEVAPNVAKTALGVFNQPQENQ